MEEAGSRRGSAGSSCCLAGGGPGNARRIPTEEDEDQRFDQGYPTAVRSGRTRGKSSTRKHGETALGKKGVVSMEITRKNF